ncbi:ribosome small subunit-dependent GTPase A [Vibrio sp.]|nr:ribosome small subunit-dependent GTPase A [Vibrio sp.]
MTLNPCTFSFPLSLQELGWNPFFQQQLSLDDYNETHLGRIIAHHRSGYIVITESQELHLEHHNRFPTMTVGDWILLDTNYHFKRVLERKSVFARKAPGSQIKEQLISANIDTVFIVCSLNKDFNLSRIERYLTLVNDSESEAVIVLTKVDLCEDSEEKRKQVQSLNPFLMIEMVNALDSNSTAPLLSWCTTGKTIAFMGSSGVGKSTLVNQFLNQNIQVTQSIREDDSKGRHTTTARSLYKMNHGGLLLDTPGMRELQLAGSEEGVTETFSDIVTLTKLCRFSDCQHTNEPGCAIQRALKSENLDERRFNNYQKIRREQLRNSASLAEKRSKDKEFGKFINTVQAASRKQKKGY